MTKIKSIPKADVEKLIKDLEQDFKKIMETADSHPFGGHSMALGRAEVVIKMLIMKLKQEYPI